jgi:lipopolysaccharide export system permease protein
MKSAKTSKLLARIYPSLLQRYLLQQFFSVFFLCLLTATSLFLVFETFERMRVFLREDSTFFDAISYLLFKVPFIVHLMTPVSILIATLLSVGRLSQLSEITAMRACGASVFSLAKPLITVGIFVSGLMFLAGETIVPWSTERGQEVYNIDIRKKDQKGSFSRTNFWFRDDNSFYSIGFYDSSGSSLQGISRFELDENFKLVRRTDAKDALWGKNSLIGWTMNEVIEIGVQADGRFDVERFKKIPLLIDETPEDFYNMKRRAETMSYQDLKKYIAKLKSDGVSSTRYAVDLAAKISFPFVNVVAVLVGFAFALLPARSGSMSISFVAGVSFGFAYYVVHAISISLGAAELIPIVPAAWTANILMGCLGGYLLAGSEFQ